MKTKENEVTPQEITQSLQEILTKQLQELNRKKALADRREIFLLHKKNLETYREELKAEIESGSFESSKAKIAFQKAGYREENIFSISHPDLIISFINNLLSEIDLTVSKLENQLIA